MAAVEEEQLDPRVQVELELLNTATDDINKLEAKLEEANNSFRTTLSESTERLKTLAKKLGGCIERARPYYEALDLARSSQLDCQRAAVQYQRANALHQAAKETIAKAEEMFVHHAENRHFDSTWQEVLNRAIIKVMEAEAQKASSEREHLKRAATYQQAERQVQQLHRGLRSSISKSLVYFEEKARVQAQLDAQKEHVHQLQQAVIASKTAYAQSLRRLEQISEQIHEQRRCQLPREPGVGAELPPAPASDTRPYPHSVTPPHDLTALDEEYWENLRDKLARLEASSGNQDGSGDSSSETDQERSVTGSSATDSVSQHDPVGNPNPRPTCSPSTDIRLGNSSVSTFDSTHASRAGGGSSNLNTTSHEVKNVTNEFLIGQSSVAECTTAKSSDRVAEEEKISEREIVGASDRAAEEASEREVEGTTGRAAGGASKVEEDKLVRQAPVGGYSASVTSQDLSGTESNIHQSNASSNIIISCNNEKNSAIFEQACVGADMYLSSSNNDDKNEIELHNVTVTQNSYDSDLRTAVDEDDSSDDDGCVALSGRSSPSPTQCQPSKMLCVIPEELEHCSVLE